MSAQKESVVRPAQGSHLETVARLASEAKPECKNAAGPSRAPQAPRGNVVSGEAHGAAIGLALDAVARIVGGTLGPHGSNTLVRDESGEHFATKDGYSVLQRLTFVQETATMVLDHVRSVSRTLVRRVGDGSTSAVIMASSLYRSFSEAGLTNRYPPGLIQVAMSASADVLAELIQRSASPVTPENLVNVATIAANNDAEIGRLVAGIYANYGAEANVFVTTGGERTTVSREPGYKVLRGMAHPCFANEVGIDGAAKTTCRLTDAHVMILGDVVDQRVFNTLVAPVMNRCLERGESFVLVAKEYGDSVLSVVANFMKGSPGAKVLLVDHAMATRRGAARLGDLATVLGCAVVDRNASADVDVLFQHCGHAEEVRSTYSETTFITAAVNEHSAARALELEQQIERVDTSNNAEVLGDELAELRARVRALRGIEVTITVGGATEQERRALQYLVEDSVLAVRSAIRSGIVEGLGLTAMRVFLSEGNDRRELVAAVASVLENCTRVPADRVRDLVSDVLSAILDAYILTATRVLENARTENPTLVLHRCVRNGESYDALVGAHVPVGETPVVNPADTDIEVLRGALSIVALFITSNQTVLSRPIAGGGLD